MSSSAPAPPRRRYHFQTPGVVYVLVTLLVALGAFNSQNNLLFWAFGLALAVLIVSGMISGQMLMGIRVVRDAPARAVAGRAEVVRYRVENQGRLAPAFALQVSERVAGASAPAPRPPRAGTPARSGEVSAAPTGELAAIPAFVVHVGARDSVVAEGVVTPAARGVLRLDGPVVSSAFPFGIILKSLTFSQVSSILVHPAPVELPAGVKRGMAGVGRGATRSGARTGEGTEFFALREYVPGDPLTRIAWRASARGRDLLVRQTTFEEARSVWIVLDLAVRDATGADALERVERAIAVAGQCVREVTAAGVACGLAVPAAEVQIPPRGAANQSLVLLDALAVLDGARMAGSGRGAPFPTRILRSGAPVIVHAGMVDRSFGPATAMRVSGADGGGS
jgi:uncharacterized protein (DUF58 family)